MWNWVKTLTLHFIKHIIPLCCTIGLYKHCIKSRCDQQASVLTTICWAVRVVYLLTYSIRELRRWLQTHTSLVQIQTAAFVGSLSLISCHLSVVCNKKCKKYLNIDKVLIWWLVLGLVVKLRWVKNAFLTHGHSVHLFNKAFQAFFFNQIWSFQ